MALCACHYNTELQSPIINALPALPRTPRPYRGSTPARTESRPARIGGGGVKNRKRVKGFLHFKADERNIENVGSHLFLGELLSSQELPLRMYNEDFIPLLVKCEVWLSTFLLKNHLTGN